MTKEREALKLALEALESERMYFWNSPERIENAITAIEEALEQPERKYTTTRNAWTGKATHKCNVCGRDDFRTEHAAKFHTCAVLAQPEQEPQPPYEFDRYVAGSLMAQGVRVERATTLADAIRIAANICPQANPPSFPTVLVYTTSPQPKEAEQEPYLHEEMQDEILRLSEIISANTFYQSGHADALEWAAEMAVLEDPQTSDWVYDDPYELAKALRKGPDFLPSPPQRKPLTDEEIEATFTKCGGKWNGDQWVIEDADLHPFVRTIEHPELNTLRAISDEYNAWIKHHAAGHTYDDFLVKRLAAHGIKGEA